MRLNVGSGTKYLSGWTNVDKYAAEMGRKVDVTADMLHLPFDGSSVDSVLFLHVIEHVSQAEGVEALREIHRVLKPGGDVAVETPDKLKLLSLLKGIGPCLNPDANMVEGSRAATGPIHDAIDAPVFAGVKGALGGISGAKRIKGDWHQWLLAHAQPILEALEEDDITRVPLPPNMRPGEPHLFLWDAERLKASMEALGFTCRIEEPQWHGKRVWRDCRVVGVKA